MRSTIRTVTLALLLVPLGGWSRLNEQLLLQPQSKLWVEGGSTIRGWSCAAGDVNADVVTGGPNAIPLLLTGERAVKAVTVILPAEKLDCGNGTMNDHMKKALKTSDFATIEFRLSSYDLTKSSDGISGTLNGTLVLGGVKKAISIVATGTDFAGALHVLGAYDLKMTDYDLTPPSLMFGRIKVRDVVTVKFDLVLKS